MKQVWQLALAAEDRVPLPTTSSYPSPVGGGWGCLKAKLEILSNLSLSLFFFCLFSSPQSLLLVLFSCFWLPGPNREGSGNDLLTPIDWLVTPAPKCPHTAALPTSLWSLIVQEAYSSLEKLDFLGKLVRNCFWRARLTEALGSFWNQSPYSSKFDLHLMMFWAVQADDP